ncbi:serine/threonine protein phosphatase [Weizmannia acidilactici]|uniref:Serine/threonine protein phosphatase n=1 Tax=Weizmannia acidilactici TaxID=2607726 RepID=A0A5J4JAZ2_9BACI|nr:metallophosphoesterase family protein [Weizmannia acidilactici]GER67672.1 serine/threonine protein phosphatase [Weizmannia acidilactici]GER68911.1 serine/threonine protein phosphatase [Weizmannia acidilactici]GER73909.1 serine/threonine protein phosphatase [Weizmannia acidilactici]
MGKRLLAVSDIHGCFDEFEALLELSNYDPSKDRLILLGDYVDRGPKSKEVLYKIKSLVEKEHAVALKGNHDQMFCDWLNDSELYHDIYMQNGGKETIRSFLSGEEMEPEAAPERLAANILANHAEMIGFLQGLPYYHEEEEYIFVHAGINPLLDDWKETGARDFLWIREGFLDQKLSIPQTVIHGHTPAVLLHGSSDVYFGDHKICVDGACAYGYQLNMLEINNEAFHVYHVGKNSGA